MARFFKPLSSSSETPSAQDVQSRDVAYVQRSQAGDTAARNELVALYQPLAFKVANSFGSYVHDPDDLAQEALLYLTKRVNDYNPERGASFMTYAFDTILGRVKGYVYHNRHKFSRLVSLYKETGVDGFLLDLLSDDSEDSTSPDRNGMREEASLFIHKYVSKLPPEEKIILEGVLHHKSRKKIAKELGKSREHVVRRYRRALKRLRVAIRESGEEGKLEQIVK